MAVMLVWGMLEPTRPPMDEKAPDKAALLREPIPVGVAACLLGQKVRYNGGDKYDEFVVESLGKHFEWVPVCPEMEIGLGVPRESIHQVRKGKEIRLETTKTKRDLTSPMMHFSTKRAVGLAKRQICGYVFKKASPSCGMERVRVYPVSGIPEHQGRGFFASALMEAIPNLPVEEEGRLRNLALRENWIERVFAYHRLRTLFGSKWGMKSLIRFHTDHKLTVLAHSTQAYHSLGQLVATAKPRSSSDRVAIAVNYESQFMSALKQLATAKKHTNVLQHMLGYLKKNIDSATKRDILAAIEDYRLGIFPLTVPLILLQHYLRKYEVTYLLDQIYLNPHPKELALRNFMPE